MNDLMNNPKVTFAMQTITMLAAVATLVIVYVCHKKMN